MNKEHLNKVILISSLIGVTLFAASFYFPLSSMFSFPYLQIATGLKALSFSGSLGNIVAILLYVVISVLPIFYYYYVGRKRKHNNEDSLLILYSFLLFAVLYLLINPAYLMKHYHAEGSHNEVFGIAGILLHSVLLSYLIFRLLRTFSSSGEEKQLLKHLKLLILLLSCASVIFLVGAGLYNAKTSIQALYAGNQSDSLMPMIPGQSNELSFSVIVIILQHLVANLPLLFQIVIFYFSFSLLEEIEVDFYSQEVGNQAAKLVTLSKKAVVWILLSQLFLNLLQFAVGAGVKQAHVNLLIPFSSITFVLLALLFAKYFEKMRQLKEDVDSFI